MKRSVLCIMIGIVLVALIGTICSAAFTPEFELIPFSMKDPSDTKPYNDDGFISDAKEVVEKVSNTTVPTGSKLNDITDAYYRLIMENVSPPFLETANNIVGYLYYTSKAGEAYVDYQNYKNSVSRTTDGSEYYTLADQYRQVAAEFWKRIQDRYPNQTMYTLPDASAPMPEEEETNQASTLEGLEIGIPISQKNSNPNGTDQTDTFKTTTIRWFEDYVDQANEPDQDSLMDNSNESPGRRFLTGEGVQWADSTYMDLVGMNVAEDFYKKAQYIDAFFYLISQARDLYEEYNDDRTFVSSVSNGKENYDNAKKYYDEAGKAISYFSDIIPNGTNSTLPDFPKMDEVTMGGPEYGKIGYITSDMADYLSQSGIEE